MKRSRIFLGATTALLAIAGIAAAKAHRVPSHTVFFYTKTISSGDACTKTFNTFCTRGGLDHNCVTPTDGYQLYSLGGGSVSGQDAVICGHPVKYNAD